MRAAAVILDGSKVAMIERHRGPTVYYLFPGGKVEAGEIPEQAAIREAHEELGLIIQIGRLIAQVTFGASVQYYYLATVQGGEFGTGDGEEYSANLDPAAGSYHPIWVEIGEFKEKSVRPAAVAELVALSQTQGWPDTVQLYEESA